MKYFKRNSEHNKKGFTLIEVIVVLIILGVLAAIALPAYYGWMAKSTVAKAFETTRGLKFEIAACMTAKNALPGFDLTADCLNPIRARFTDNEFYVLGLTAAGNSAHLFLERAPATGDVIDITFDSNGSASNCRGYGNYQGFC